ncbi:hypothetical protein WA171_005901 [Blastocystis sp. BT1]
MYPYTNPQGFGGPRPMPPQPAHYSLPQGYNGMPQYPQPMQPAYNGMPSLPQRPIPAQMPVSQQQSYSVGQLPVNPGLNPTPPAEVISEKIPNRSSHKPTKNAQVTLNNIYLYPNSQTKESYNAYYVYI